MKEIKEDTSKWEDILCSWIRRLISLKCIATQGNIQIQWTVYQNSRGILHRNRTDSPKTCVKS